MPYQVLGARSGALAVTVTWTRSAIARSAGSIFAMLSSRACSPSAFFAPLLPSARNSSARCFMAARSAAGEPSVVFVLVWVDMLVLSPSSGGLLTVVRREARVDCRRSVVLLDGLTRLGPRVWHRIERPRCGRTRARGGCTTPAGGHGPCPDPRTRPLTWVPLRCRQDVNPQSLAPQPTAAGAAAAAPVTTPWWSAAYRRSASRSVLTAPPARWSSASCGSSAIGRPSRSTRRPTTTTGRACSRRPASATSAATTAGTPPPRCCSPRTCTRGWSWSCSVTAGCARRWTSTAMSCPPWLGRRWTAWAHCCSQVRAGKLPPRRPSTHEVELLQALAGREPGGPDPTLPAVGLPRGDLPLQEGDEELLVRPGLGPRPLGQPAHRLARGGRPQRPGQERDLRVQVPAGGRAAHATPPAVPSVRPRAVS